MEVLDVIRLYGPLAALGGGAYAIVKQAFAFVWRLAAVERTTAENSAAIRDLKAPLDRMETFVARIDERLEHLEARGIERRVP